MRIQYFGGENAFLSNFYICPVTYDGIEYSSSEAAFQAQKCKSKEDRKEFSHFDPKYAKRRGRKVELRDDWDDIKLKVMEEIVYAKFTQNNELKRKLIETGDAELIEGNYWGDRFWGVDVTGENHLGEILMKVREELKEGKNG